MDERLNLDEMLEILESRSAVYSFLSSVYGSEASHELLVQLREQMADRPAELHEGEGYSLLRDFMLTIDEENLSRAKTELASEYAKLFLGMSPRPVPPYASVHTSTERLIKQEEYDQVRAEYRAEGIYRSDGFKEPEDHIALEMAFMAHLCRQMTESLRSQDIPRARHYLLKQRDFLFQHLQNWVPQFCQLLRRAARTDFYRGIAGITEEHLEYEKETVKKLLAELSSM